MSNLYMPRRRGRYNRVLANIFLTLPEVLPWGEASQAPQKSGWYALLDLLNGYWLYLGQAVDLRARLRVHERDQQYLREFGTHVPLFFPGLIRYASTGQRYTSEEGPRLLSPLEETLIRDIAPMWNQQHHPLVSGNYLYEPSRVARIKAYQSGRGLTHWL